jgi:hypothetical protein
VARIIQCLDNRQEETRNDTDTCLTRKPPNTLPLVGNGILFLQARQKLLSWFVKCERQHGYETLALSVPTLPPGVLISDPKIVDFIFHNEGVFTKGDFVKRRSWDLFGELSTFASFIARLSLLSKLALPHNYFGFTEVEKGGRRGWPDVSGR